MYLMINTSEVLQILSDDLEIITVLFEIFTTIVLKVLNSIKLSLQMVSRIIVRYARH